MRGCRNRQSNQNHATRPGRKIDQPARCPNRMNAIDRPNPKSSMPNEAQYSKSDCSEHDVKQARSAGYDKGERSRGYACLTNFCLTASCFATAFSTVSSN